MGFKREMLYAFLISLDLSQTKDQLTMKAMTIPRQLFAMLTLGLLCGWYYFILILYPLLLYTSIFTTSFILRMISIITFATFIVLSIIPIKFPQYSNDFLYSWIFEIWCEYFDFTLDYSKLEAYQKLHEHDTNIKYMFVEFPHGIFPMGQFLSASKIRDILPGHMVHGTGADIIFQFPIMRHIMAWIGTVPAKRENIRKIYSKPKTHCAIIPGGIAEMYLMNTKSEGIYLKQRHNTIKLAIQNGAHIVPTFVFGNTKIFNLVGNNDSNVWLSKLSRKFRASILLFYGKFFLPIPLRHPLNMCIGNVIEVKQNDNPTMEEIQIIMDKVINETKDLYNTNKPSWETRPLEIS